MDGTIEDEERKNAGLPPPCLILLDVMMPVMGGWDFLRALRASAEWSQVPVIMISAAEPQKGHPVEPDAFLKKPFSVAKLLQSLQSKI